MVMDAMALAINLTSLTPHNCAVCAPSRDTSGSDIGLGDAPEGEAADLTYLAGGTSFTGTDPLAAPPPRPQPGENLRPLVLDERDTWQRGIILQRARHGAARPVPRRARAACGQAHARPEPLP